MVDYGVGTPYFDAIALPLLPLSDTHISHDGIATDVELSLDEDSIARSSLPGDGYI
ncbi:MAG: hypothetical protein ACLFSD_00065 [Salinivenus sp.]